MTSRFALVAIDTSPPASIATARTRYQARPKRMSASPEQALLLPIFLHRQGYSISCPAPQNRAHARPEGHCAATVAAILL